MHGHDRCSEILHKIPLLLQINLNAFYRSEQPYHLCSPHFVMNNLVVYNLHKKLSDLSKC